MMIPGSQKGDHFVIFGFIEPGFQAQIVFHSADNTGFGIILFGFYCVFHGSIISMKYGMGTLGRIPDTVNSSLSVYNPPMLLTVDAVIQIAAFSTGIGSLIVLIYLSLPSGNRSPRLGLMVVLLHALNYFAGILFYIDDAVFRSGLLAAVLTVIQLLSVPFLLYFVFRLTESLGTPRFPALFSAGKMVLPVLLLVETAVFITREETLYRAVSLLVLLFGLYLWGCLLSVRTAHPLARAVRLTGLIGYGVIIPWMALDRLIPASRLLHPADAVSFLFLTISALIFSIRYLMNREPSAAAPSSEPPHNLQQQFGLTDRETEVLELLTESCSYKDIASRLGISLATVKTHVSRVYRKTGTTGRSELKFRFHRPE